MYLRLGSAAVAVCHPNINESITRLLVKKKKRKFMKLLLQLCQQVQKSYSFCEITFLSCIENVAFVRVQDCCKKGTPID